MCSAAVIHFFLIISIAPQSDFGMICPASMRSWRGTRIFYPRAHTQDKDQLIGLRVGEIVPDLSGECLVSDVFDFLKVSYSLADPEIAVCRNPES